MVRCMFGGWDLILDVCVTESARPNYFLIFDDGSGVSRNLQLLPQIFEHCFKPGNLRRKVISVHDSYSARCCCGVCDCRAYEQRLSRKSHCENQREWRGCFELHTD